MKKRFLSLVALGMALGLVFMGCGDGAGGGSSPQSVKYTSKDGAGNTYELTITENTTKAAKPGDSYVLTITSASGAVKTSSGTVQSTSDGILKLKPSSGTTFTVTLVGENMGSISEPITLDNGLSESAPSGPLIPSGISGDMAKFQGNWTFTYQGGYSYHVNFTGNIAQYTMVPIVQSDVYDGPVVFSVNETTKKITISIISDGNTAWTTTGDYAFDGNDKFVLSSFDKGAYAGTYFRVIN
ncbi:hypothetical protein AGMMS49546_25550 [Spirochaetia bacterium]|nr:hypothetical protein AGMMS49546_25550 [Spirochaetia bacterium]